MLRLICNVYSVILSTFESIICVFLAVSMFISFCWSMGWLKRFVWHFIEIELSKALNDAVVTLESLQIDFLRGKITVNNIVIHTPHQKEWHWESPLIGRIGKVYVEWNMIGILLQLGTRSIDEIPVDFYTITLSDIQAFVERQQHVFNFYLLDRQIILPDPSTIVLSHDTRDPSHKDSDTKDNKDNKQTSTEQSQSQSQTQSLPQIAQQENQNENQEAHQEAQELVAHLVEAVKTLGNKNAWKAQRDHLTRKLKELQSTKKGDMMQEGVKVIQQVGKVAKKGILPSIPQRREGTGKSEKILQCRVGRIVISDARIFTRDSLAARWNKPICIREVILRAAELCPPMSSTDEQGWPSIYQSIEKILEVCKRRILTETAKSQSGKLLNTAVSEVLGIITTSQPENQANSNRSA